MTKSNIPLLLIEDSPSDALLLEDVLNSDPLNSFELTISERLETGLEALRRQKHDLVLLDLGLPDSQGLKTFEKLHKEFPDLPVVVLSGLMDERLALEAVQAGAQDYLVKGPTSWEIAPRAIRYAIERKRVEKELRESEEKYRLLVENAPVGIFQSTPEGRYISVNPALASIFSYDSPEEMMIQVTDIARQIHVDSTQREKFKYLLAKNGEIREFVNQNYRRDGSIIWTITHARTVKDKSGDIQYYEGFMSDITERKNGEEALRHRLAELETLYESGLSLSQLLEPKEVGQKIIDVLAEKLEWSHTTIRLYHPESDSLELLAYNLAYKTTEKEWLEVGERFKALISKPGDGLSGWVIQHGEIVRCSDVLHDSRYIETVPGLNSGLYVPLKAGDRTIGVISVESEIPDYFTPEDEHMAITLAAQAAAALENIRLFKDLQRSNDDLFRAYDDTIEGWSNALDLRDKETEGHTQRVTALTEELARAMGIPDTNMIHVRRGALLHDIGKMGVPDRILLKPDKLTDDEWVIMREHPVHAYNLLSRIEFLQPAINIPHYHHEKWDGSGYPEGLKGEQIPLEARVFAIIDVFDALTSDRPYRPAWPRAKAINFIRENSGAQFDPRVLEAFMKLINGK